MRLEVGPVELASAAAWIEWAEGVFGEPSATTTSLSTAAVDDLRGCLEQWKPASRSAGDSFRWQGEVDPDHLAYLAHSFFTLDAQLSYEVERGQRVCAPEEARDFHLVLVRALLHALERESPVRAAFVDQLRSSWPSAEAAI